MAHFDVRIEDGVSDVTLGQLAADRLRAESTLLILDNVETLLTAEQRQWKDSAYEQFLLRWVGGSDRAAPGQIKSRQSVVMMTSREEPDMPNNLMRYCRWYDLSGLMVNAGVGLLEELGVLGDNDSLTTFVSQSAGHPLLLKLAAGWLQVEEADEPRIEYLRNIDGLNLFEFMGAHRGEPETSVRRILEATLSRLPAQMAELLPALSLYRRTFSLAAAQVMSRETLVDADLRKLVKRSLLQAKKQTKGGERLWLFEFQPLIQRYLQPQADKRNHQKAIDYYLRVRQPVLGATDDLSATAEYQEIFHHQCELENYAQALRLLRIVTDENKRYSSCDMVLQLRGYNAIRLILYERLAQAWKTQLWQPQEIDEIRLVGDTLQTLGDVLQFLKRSNEAIANYDEALTIYRAVGDRLGEANTLKALGRLQEDVQQGLAYLQSAQTLYEQINDIYSQGVNLYYLGNMYAQLQQYESALSALQTAIARGKQINFAPLIEAAEQAIQDLSSDG